MSLQSLPKGMEPIFSEVRYDDFKDIETVRQFIQNELETFKHMQPKDLHFLIEQKLSGHRPGNKFYVGNEIMFIVKYIEPRNSVFQDVVGDRELCILQPQHFNHNDLKKLIEDLQK